MLLRIQHLLLLLGCSIISISADAKNETKEVKSKRGIYHLSDPTYNVLPLHHLTRYTQVRALADDAPQVDITYKPHEDVKPQLEHSLYPQNTYDYGDPLKVSSNNHNQYKFNEPTHLNHQHYPSYAAHYPNPIAQQTAKSHDHLALPPQHLVAPQYSQYQNISPLPFYRADKHLTLPANIRTSSEIKLPEYLESYTTIPIIYGQPGGNLPSLKYIQPLPKNQYNLPTYNTLPLQNSYQPSPYKLPVKLHVAPLQQHRLPQPGLIQNYKPIHSNYYQPQVFDNPIVPQLQHYIPPVQSPFDAFTKPVPIAPVVPKPTPAPPKREQEEESDEDDEDETHERKEVRGEIVRHEVNDEEEFDKGYDEAGRSFPQHDDDDDYRRPRYHNDDEDRYERYRTRYDADHDDDHRGHYSTVRERSRKPYDHEDDRRGRYADRDHEAHYSQKSSKKEPREKHQKSKSSYETQSKYYRNDDSERSPKKSAKYYKSSTKKPYSDSRYVSSSPKKQTINKKSASKSKESASSRSEVEFKPNYEYGFEPIKVADSGKSREADSVAKHSEPNQSRKLYKENWFYSKTSKSP